MATASCSTAPSGKVLPSRDISDARPIARELGDILLKFSAYDYAVVGGINGERIRAVTPERYAAVARAQAGVIADTVPTIIAAAIETIGPVHDRLVALADHMAALRTDALAYSDARTPEVLARILNDVDTGWSLLRSLESLLKDDGTLDRVAERGTSMRIAVAPGQQALVTIGPFAGPDEAAAKAAELGPGAAPATTSPYVVRISYKDRAAADASATALQKQGIAAIVIDQTAYAFTRGGTPPDVELWREPERFIDARADSRRIALSINGGLIATGSDDGYVSIFTSDGVLRSLPKFTAGVSQLVFSDDARFLIGGGQTLVTWSLPRPTDYLGTAMRLQSIAQSVVYIPRANAFAAASGGDGSTGIIGGRSPDGVVLGDPFPIVVSSAGAMLGASDAGELFVASQVGGEVDLRVVRVGVERGLRGIVRVPGQLKAFAVDQSGALGAIVSDQGTYRVSLKAADPSKTITKLAPSVRDVKFSSDGTLYLLEGKKISAISGDATVRWSKPLVDGRRLVVGSKPIVLDGTDQLYAFSPADGSMDSLAPVGTIQDLVVSRDGRWVGVIAEAKRAVLFKLQ
ncbi:MAG: hypothetical protein M3R54_04210 [Chloroflexota bacterium]|nr:hypothetical protein [Chloroflexota bacterium]